MQKELLIIFVVIVLELFLLFKHHEINSKVLDQLGYKVSKIEEEVNLLSSAAGNLNKVAKAKDNLEKKLSIIHALKQKKLGPTKIMEQLSLMIPKRVWLSSLTVSGVELKVLGAATSNEEISMFMSKLEKSGFFRDVDLSYTDKDKAIGETAKKKDEEVFGVGFEINMRFEG